MANLILWTGIERDLFLVRTGGVYQLASYIRQHGYTVKVIDFCRHLSTDQLVKITEKHIERDTYAIGVSSTFWNTNEDALDSRVLLTGGAYEPDWVISGRDIIERSNKNIKWILGGSNSHSPILKKDWIRFHQYGEDPLLKWLNEQSGNNHSAVFDIKNTVKYYEESDAIQPYEFLQLELGRGCIFKCKYCSFPNIGKLPGTYLRCYEDLRREVIENYDRWGVYRYYYTDDTVNESEEKVLMLLKLAQSLPFKIQWIGYSRADMIWSKPHMADWLTDSGLVSTDFGIESFNPYSSKIVGKGWSGKHGKDWLLKIKEQWNNKCSMELLMIAGLPGWSEKEYYEDCEWLSNNDMDSYWFFPLYINPNFGTKGYHSEFDLNYKKYGYWFEEGNNMNWKYDGYDRDYVKTLEQKRRDQSANRMKIAGFYLGDVASLDYDIDQLRNTRTGDFNWTELNLRRINFINNYVQKNI